MTLCSEFAAVVRLGLLGLVAVPVAGCAGFGQKLQRPTITEKREDRSAEALREFENRRDAAQLAAALDRFQSGDASGAESMLAGIVNRRPDYHEARLRLAEVQWSRGDGVSAEGHFRAVLAADPDRAEAHHAFGFLLEGTQRTDEACEHFAAAARLEPANDIYRQTQQSLQR